jgi:hypothetical protein
VSSATATTVPHAPPALIHEVKTLTEIGNRLADRFPHLPRERITEAVSESHRRFDHARIRDFVPVLIEREARHQLAHMPQPSTA